MAFSAGKFPEPAQHSGNPALSNQNFSIFPADDSDPDVNDFDPCTEDYCCTGPSAPIAACTAAGEIQHVQLAIGPSSEGGECCTIATHCDDFDACTLDYCDTQTHACTNWDVEETFPVDPETGESLYQCCDPSNPERQCAPDGLSCTDDVCLNYRCFYRRTAPNCCEDDDDQWCADADPAWDPCNVYTCCNEGDERSECADREANRCGERAYDPVIDDPGQERLCCVNDATCDDDNCCTRNLCCLPDDPRLECRNADPYRCMTLDLSVVQECCCFEGDSRCDDGNACTNDYCNDETEICGHEVISGCCMGGDDAVLVDDECCTVDWCDCDGQPCAEGEQGLIRHTEVDCDDDNVCTEDECECAENADGYACLNTEVAVEDMCEPGQICDPEQGCIDEPCEPDCGGKACGDDDGCGTACHGTCPAGSSCSDEFECVEDPVEPAPDIVEPDVEPGDDIVKPDVQPETTTPPDGIVILDTGQTDEDTGANEGSGGGGGCTSGTSSSNSLPMAGLILLLLASLAVLRRRASLSGSAGQ